MTVRRPEGMAAAIGLGVAALVWTLVTHDGSPAPASAYTAIGAVTSSAHAADPALPRLVLAGPQPLPSVPVVTATSLEIPAIGVRSALEPLLLGATGALSPPVDFRKAGWFARGPVPGDRGPAVIAGHVDSYDGPAVFLRLSSLRAGDVVVVHRSDGRSVRFRVASLLQVPKDSFPTRLVYGPTPSSSLRLITCGGTYDHVTHRYPDDVVVFAEVG